MKKHVFPHLLLSTLGLLLACSFKSPKAPSWDTIVNIPIADRTYTMENILAANAGLFSYENGLLGYKIEGILDTTRINGHLHLPDVSTSYQWGINDFEMPSLVASGSQFLFRQLTNEAAINNGQTASVASFSFQDVEGVQVASPDLQYANIITGNIRIKLKNRLPVDLQNVTVKMADKTTRLTILQTGPIGLLPAGDSIVVDLDVQSQVLTSSSIWLLSGSSPGTESKVPIRAEQPVQLLASLVNIRVRNLIVKMPEINFSWKESLPLDESVFIQEAKLQSGNIIVELQNNLPIKANVKFRLDFIYNSVTGRSLGDSLSIDAHKSSLLTLDLAGYIIDLSAGDSGQQALPVFVSGTTAGSNQEFITLTDQQMIKMNIGLRDVAFEYLKGMLDEQEIAIPPTEKSFQRPEELDKIENVELHDARLFVDVYNTIHVPVRLAGILTGYNEAGESVTFNVDQAIRPGNGEGGSEVTHIGPFTPQNSPILDFINLKPTRVAALGSVWIGDGQTVGYVNMDDYVFATYRFEAAANLSWRETTLHADTARLIIQPENAPAAQVGSEVEEIDAGLTNRLVSASILLNIENHLPIAASVQFYFARDSSKLLTAPDVISGPFTVKQGVLDDGGAVSVATKQELTIQLSAEDMAILQNRTELPQKVFVLTNITLPSTENRPVKIYASDFIHVQSLAKLVVRIEE